MPNIIKKHTLVNFTNKKINVKYIVEHDTGVKGQTAKGNANYFYDTFRGASAHYFVDKNDIYEVVPAGIMAWAVGDDKAGDKHDVGDKINNSNTVHIELCAEKDGSFHKNTIALGAWLTKKLMKDYNIPASRVVRHYDASGKNCPQFMNTDGKWTLWKKYHKELTGQTVVSAPSNGANNKKTSHVVVAGDTLFGLSKQYNATVSQLKEWNNLKSDTIVIGQTLILQKGATKPTNNPSPVESTPKANLKVDGYIGKNVVRALQIYFNTAVDGEIWGQHKNSITTQIASDAIKFNSLEGSPVIRELQKLLGVKQDGLFGEATLRALQKRMGTPVDGKLSRPSTMVKELQMRLNKGKM